MSSAEGTRTPGASRSRAVRSRRPLLPSASPRVFNASLRASDSRTLKWSYGKRAVQGEPVGRESAPEALGDGRGRRGRRADQGLFSSTTIDYYRISSVSVSPFKLTIETGAQVHQIKLYNIAKAGRLKRAIEGQGPARPSL